jgi:AraC-like DNA-binding protein
VIKTLSPTSPFLKKYIECFYIYEGEPTSKFSYVAFPHFNTGLSFFKGASIQRKQWGIEISECIDIGIHIEILGKYTSPVLIEYTGKVREISIVFKPLGLNRFFSASYQSIAPHFSQQLNNTIWSHFGENLFTGENDLNKLETFLIAQFADNDDFKPIEESLKVLENSNNETSISALANKVGYNLKTFQRHFKKHMGCSPIEFRRICRFRNSLTNKLQSAQWKNLTEITYDAGYFDQSHLIKEFRKLTNHNPTDFFKVASKVDCDKIVWEIK